MASFPPFSQRDSFGGRGTKGDDFPKYKLRIKLKSMILAFFVAITAWLLSLFLPWWSAFIPGFILGAILAKSGWHAFNWGFAGIGVLWLIQTLYIHISSDGILTTRIADLFSLPAPVLVIIITVLIGGLIGGCSTLTGYLFRKIIS
jgi:ABC-type multidrug transport system fused ATPase/permease subunit